MKKKRMSSTRIHFRIEQKVRKGNDYLWITVRITAHKKANQEKPHSTLNDLRRVFLGESENFEEGDAYIGACIRSVLSDFPKTPKVGRIWLRGGDAYRANVYWFRIEVPI